jgi:zinc transport system substrate-binding protein
VNTSSGVELIENNPHIWLSPKRAIIQASNILDSLVKSDPEGSKIYRENAEKYIENLEVLDRGMREEIKTWKRKEFVVFNSAFLYFTMDYGLKQAAVIQESHEKEPTPKYIAYVIDTIQRKGIREIFSEPQFSHKLVRTIAKDLNLSVYSLDTLETGDFNSGWYEERIKANFEVLKKALKSD